MTKEEVKKPIASANVHGVNVAMWENINKEGGPYKSVNFYLSRKQEDGTYKKRTMIFPSDLENIINAFTEVKKQAEEQGIKTKFEKKGSED